MQIQAVGSFTIELIAFYRMVESLRIGAVYPKLMSSTGVWNQRHPDLFLIFRKHMIFCDSSLTVFKVNLLSRSVIDIRRER
jgi:hypothetical protein